jgi:hypothetical protein
MPADSFVSCTECAAKVQCVGGGGNVSLTMYFFTVAHLETWSLTLREEHRLRVFENKVLKRTFGPKRDEVTGEWRKIA